MKRIFKTLIVALCFTAAACTTDYQVDIDDLNDRIDSLEKNQIASITQQIASINTTLPQLTNTSAELKGMIESMKQTIQDYRDVVVNNEAKLAALKAEIEGEISKLSSDIEKSQDADKKEMLAALKATQAELEGQLEAMKTEAAAKEKQMEETLKLLEEKDASLTDRIDKLQTFVTDELASAKSYNEKTYATLAQQQLIEYDIAAIKTSIEDLEDSMTELETRLTENYTAAIEKATQSLNAAIENATKSLNEKINSWASALLTGYTNAISKAKSEITTAYESKIKESIDALRTEVKGWVNEKLELYYTAAQMDTKLAGLKTDLEGQLAAQKAYLEKADSVLRADFEADDDVLDSLIAVNAAAIKTNEAAIKSNKEAIAKINDVTLPALKEEITKAYTQAITDGIAAACKENGTIDKRIDELIGANNLRLLDMYINPMKTDIKALQDTVKVLREDITKLSEKIQAVSDKLDGFINGRIQSLTYIPVSADGQYLAGLTDYYVYGDFVMNFQVNPVSMANGITAENISAKVSYMSPYGKQHYYESVKVKDVGVDKESGIITVTVAAADVFNRTDDEKYDDFAIWRAHNAAISVSVKDTDEKHAETYYDVASDFVYLNTQHFFINFTTPANVATEYKDKFYAHKFQLNDTNSDYNYGENTAHLLGHNFIHVDNTTQKLDIKLAKGAGSYKNDKVKSVFFGGLYERGVEKYCTFLRDVALKTGENAFSNCPYLDTVDITSLDVRDVQSFESMFENDYALKDVYIDGDDVDDVTTVAKMFKNCTSLEKVNLKGWATQKITDFSEMFAYCTKLYLADQNWSSFSTTNAVNFSGMFRGTAITKVDFGYLNIKVNSLQNMFNGCDSLKTVKLTGNQNNNCKVTMVNGANYEGVQSASSTADLGHMFDGCTALESVVISDLTFEQMPDFEYMFNNCKNLKTITLEYWYITTDYTGETYNAIVNSMFASCDNLTEVKMKGSSTYAVNLIKKALTKCGKADILKTQY